MIKIPSKYPIIASAMNQVSYAKFAVHCYHAGLMPSISIFNYYKNKNLDYKAYNSELELFKQLTNSNSVIISCSAEQLLDIKFLELVQQYNLKYFELIEGFSIVPRTQFLRSLKSMQTAGCKFFIKALDTSSDYLDLFDGIILKGNEGAGRSISTISLKDNFKKAREKYPNLAIIPSGGIHSKEQIDYFLQNGAPAVSIGTLFVASNECRVATSLKHELVLKTSADLTRIDFSNTFASQQGLVYGFVGNDDENHTFSLISKVRGNSTGVIFAGSAIDHIKKIRPLSEIVSELI